MLLTRKKLNELLQNWRLSILPELGKELLAQYGNPATGHEGNLFEYTEQDIYEQLRKKLLHVKNLIRR